MYRIMIEIERTSGNVVTKEWVNLLGKTLTDAIIDPTVQLALNKAGKAEFTVPASHPYYSDLKPMKTNIEIFEIDDNGINEYSIFFGRVSDISIDWWKQKKVTCEGALAFFNDTIQRYKRYSAASTHLKDFFKSIITRHNSQMTDETRKINIIETVSDPDYYIDLKDPEDKTQTINNKLVYRVTNYETSMDVLTEMCLNSEGGHFEIFRKKVDNEYKTYIKWVSEIDKEIMQHAQFGLNLLDLSQVFEVDELYTAILPLGADYDVYEAVTNPSGNPSEKGWYIKNDTDGTYQQTSDEEVPSEDPPTYYVRYTKPITVSSVNNNKDYVSDPEAVTEYGFILKTKRWDDISDKNKLLKKAKEWLKTERFNKLMIECNVADLNPLDSHYDSLKLGYLVTINSKPHGIENLQLPITEINYDLNNGKKTVTIGTRERVTLTRITKNGKTREVRIPDSRYDTGADSPD